MTTASSNTMDSTIDVATLRSRLDDEDSPRILDVRTAGEFETSHIPGSYNVPLDLLREHRDEMLRHIGEDVVLVCRSGVRAAQAERTLSNGGLPGLRILEGGMASWEQSGAPVNRSRQTWDLERQVRLVTGSIVAVSVIGSTLVEPLKWLGAAIGVGLTYAALSNSCFLGMAMAKLPWNRPATDISVETILSALRKDA